MEKDYRLELLSFLRRSYPRKVNISSVVQKFLQETGEQRQAYRNILDKLKAGGFIAILPEEAEKLSKHINNNYNDSVILVSLTESGIDEIGRIEKQKIDLLNVERIYKSYPFTKFTAIFSFISALILLIIKLLEAFGISLNGIFNR